MGALPKRKISKARRDRRRSHSSVTPPQTNLCPQCHSPKLPHHVCLTCGSYAGREVITVQTPKTG